MSDMIDHLINDIDSMRDLTADELESVSGGAMMVVENPPATKIAELPFGSAV